MKKLLATFLFLITLGVSAQAETLLPPNVQTITPQEITARFEDSAQPFILFVYASWCPYCKKQITNMDNALKQNSALKLPPILAVSVDADPTAYAHFIANYPSLPWSSKLYMGQASLEEILSRYGSNFNGPIPYLAIVKDKKILKQFSGLTEAEELQISAP